MNRTRIGLVAAALVGASLVTNPAEAAQPHCKPIAHRGLYWTAGGDTMENQPKGVNIADQWGGMVEIDANVTSDGAVMALHDFGLNRLTGGDLVTTINMVDKATLQSVSHPFGPFRETTALIDRAALLDVPIMVNINRAGAIGNADYMDTTMQTLWDAAAAHPHPQRVFFGGADVQMVNRHPEAATFRRYGPDVPVSQIVQEVTDDDVDLVGLWKNRYKRSVVRRVRQAGAIVVSRHSTSAREARRAQRAGIQWVQGNGAKRVATRWCR